MSVTYDAVLDMSEDSVTFLTGLLDAERGRRGTRANTRALDTRAHAVLVLRWFLDDTRMSALARDNAISSSTAYDYHAQIMPIHPDRRHEHPFDRPDSLTGHQPEPGHSGSV